MNHLFRDLSLGNSKREPSKPTPLVIGDNGFATELPSPLGQLDGQLNDSDLRVTAFEIFAAACRTSAGKPLVTHTTASLSQSESMNPNSPSSPALQRSLTSAAASKMKKALGLRSPGSGSKKSPGSLSGSGQGKSKKPVTLGDLMRTQMRIPETVDSRVRRALLRISAGQVRKVSI